MDDLKKAGRYLEMAAAVSRGGGVPTAERRFARGCLITGLESALTDALSLIDSLRERLSQQSALLNRMRLEIAERDALADKWRSIAIASDEATGKALQISSELIRLVRVEE